MHVGTQAAGTERFHCAIFTTRDHARSAWQKECLCPKREKGRALWAWAGDAQRTVTVKPGLPRCSPNELTAKVNYRSAGGSALGDRAHPGQNAFVNATKNAPWSVTHGRKHLCYKPSDAAGENGGMSASFPKLEQCLNRVRNKTSGANRNHRQRPVWGTGSREIPRQVLRMGDSGVAVLQS
jgi:hypothetical protein